VSWYNSLKETFVSKPFDVATKQLVEVDPLAWLRFLGLPGESAELIDADLSTVVAEADRILRVTNPDYLAHFELQSSYKVDMSDRTLFYNVVAYYKYRLPVKSVLLLLRKEADGPAMSGRVAYGSLTFDYRVVRIWERSPEELLNAPLALLPLAPLSDVSVGGLPGVIQRMEERIDAEARVEERGLLWTTTALLLGLKYDAALSNRLLKGVMGMKESSTYQFILEEGRVEGALREARRMVLLMGSKRFGEADAQTQAALDNITSQQQLELLATRLFEAASWQELLN